MTNHDFKLSNCDTDSISFCKNDMSPISKEERSALLDEINSLMPEFIKFEDDGYFPSMVILRVKNYVSIDEQGKVKIKGSALKDQKQPAAIKEFKNKIVHLLLNEFTVDQLINIYHSYVKEIWNLSSQEQIKRWSAKYSLSDKTFKSERTNETKIVDAISGTEYVEGDKVWLFFKKNKSLCLVEKFDGNYDKMKLLQKLHSATEVFENVLPEIFLKYSLKNHTMQEALHKVLGLPYVKPERKKKK